MDNLIGEDRCAQALKSSFFLSGLILERTDLLS